MDLGTYELADFGAPDKAAVAQHYYDFFRQKDLSNNEIIWGKMYLKAVGAASQMNLWNGANGNNNWAGHNPTQNLVDAYQMEDGSSFFEHFKLDEGGYYVNVSGKYQNENPYHHREPIFYESILYDSAIWQPRFPNLANRDPLGIYDRRTRIIIEDGVVTSPIYGIDTRQGPIEAWNGDKTSGTVIYDNEVASDDAEASTDIADGSIVIHKAKSGSTARYDDATAMGQAIGEEGLETPATFKLTVYPNPLQKELSVELESETQEEITISIYDLLGRRVYEQKQSVVKGANQIMLDVDSWKVTTDQLLFRVHTPSKGLHQLILLKPE